MTAGVLLVLIVLALALGGCVKKYSRGDIKSYAKKIAGHKNIQVSEGYQEIQEDEEGYLDHLWTVTDEDTGITFRVLDDYYWALEEVVNRLLDDYDSAVLLALREEKKLPANTGLSVKETENSGLLQAELICSFKDMDGLNKCCEDLTAVRKALEEAGFADLKVPYTVKYDNPIRGAVDYEVDEGDTTGEIGSVGEEDFARMRKNYLTCALDYRFDDALGEFTEEEIDSLVHAEESVRLYRAPAEASGSGGTEQSSYTPAEDDYYEGVIGSPKFAGISFGTLYELLRAEGYDPEGDAWHYSVNLPDKSRLEVSYDFNDLSGYNDKEGKLQKGYYYILDDKKVRMENYYANHFEASKIKELTGLQVEEDRPRPAQTDQ